MKKSLFFLSLFLCSFCFSQVENQGDTIVFRKYLKEFELNLTWDAFEEVYKGERDRVIHLMDNCSSLNCIATTLLEIEFYVTWATVENPWKIRRANWIEEVKSCNNYCDLSKLMAEFELNVHSFATSKIWRERKFLWRQELNSMFCEF